MNCSIRAINALAALERAVAVYLVNQMYAEHAHDCDCGCTAYDIVFSECLG